MYAQSDLIERDIEAYLSQYEHKELLRFVAVGSVDDGKSTLIGRLLYDTGMVYQDQLDAIKKATSMDGVDIDLSLLTDGLTAEREQGITIDVAYRYFTTDKRKFIIADTPGHVQYTRNMVTGASTANVAIILIDARLGVLEQSRRHAYIASLLGIPHLAVCINKMDLIKYEKSTFEKITHHFQSFTESLKFKGVHFFPISALKGDNVVQRSKQTSWYQGPTVLEFLETVPLHEDRNFEDFRFPVQSVIRPHLNYRGFAGQIASGIIKKGDQVLILPSQKTSIVKAIDTYTGELEEAHVPQSITIRLEDEIDISRGDMIVHPKHMPSVDRTFESVIVWLHETPLDPGKSYWIKHTTQMVRANIEQLQWRKDMSTLEEVSADTLNLNDIGQVTFTCHRQIYFDAYDKNRATGNFIIIDSLTHHTVGAGMILNTHVKRASINNQSLSVRDDVLIRSQVSDHERTSRTNTTGGIIVITGKKGSGVHALAYELERALFDLNALCVVVEGAQIESSLVLLQARIISILVVEDTFDSSIIVNKINNDSLIIEYTTETTLRDLSSEAARIVRSVEDRKWI